MTDTYIGDLIVGLAEAYGLNFNRGSVVKYLCRAGRKGEALDDLKKAQYYLTREIWWLQEKQQLVGKPVSRQEAIEIAHGIMERAEQGRREADTHEDVVKMAQEIHKAHEHAPMVHTKTTFPGYGANVTGEEG